MLIKPRTSVLLSTALVLSLFAAGCTASSESNATIVVDASFDLKTADPARQYEPTGAMIVHSLYETLLTFEGSDISQPVPGVADYTMSEDNHVLTLTIKDGITFSDGSPMTAEDAYFSLKRLQGIQGNPSFLLEGVTVEQTSETSLTLTSAQPNPALPSILPNPALSILNKKELEKHGGTIDSSDSAEAFLNTQSAGSGPYILESFDPATQVVLSKSALYRGKQPTHERVVIRNVKGPTQKLNIEAGESHIALDLNPDQTSQLNTEKAVVHSAASRYTIFMFLNQDPSISSITSNPDFVTAVRKGLNYDKLIEIAGEGAYRPGGIVPSIIPGSLPTQDAPVFDPEGAKQALAASGYSSEKITLSFANDLTVEGLSLQALAETIQAQLKTIGIQIQLSSEPISTALDGYRSGKEKSGLWYWGPDFPDPSSYLAFTPGKLVGKRAGWFEGADTNVTELAEKARQAIVPEEREIAYRNMQKALNETGPFIPLFQPPQHIATTPSVSGVKINPLWTIAFAELQ